MQTLSGYICLPPGFMRASTTTIAAVDKSVGKPALASVKTGLLSYHYDFEFLSVHFSGYTVYILKRPLSVLLFSTWPLALVDKLIFFVSFRLKERGE